MVIQEMRSVTDQSIPTMVNLIMSYRGTPAKDKPGVIKELQNFSVKIVKALKPHGAQIQEDVLAHHMRSKFIKLVQLTESSNT